MASNGGGEGGVDNSPPFVYTGQVRVDVPRNVTRVIVDPSVKAIGRKAFQYCRRLAEVVLPEGLEVIEPDAFFQCASLTGVKIPRTVTEIGERAFAGCTRLQHLELRAGLQWISEGAFSDCSALTGIEIPATVKSIGASAFQFCWSMTSIGIPSSVASIGVSAFESCSSLAEIKIPSSVTSIGERVFHNCRRLTKVELCEGFKEIPPHAFNGCSSLTSIKILSSVRVIGCEAFANCTSLTSVELCEGLKRINMEAFCGCKSLVDIEIPATVKVIARNAFYGCGRLKSIESGEGGDSTFIYTGQQHSDIPRDVTHVAIDQSVKTIGREAFRGCKQLAEVDLCEGLEQIEANAFGGCISLTSINIPSTVKGIGDFAFGRCEKLADVDLGVGLERINWGAFTGCRALKHARIPSKVKAIGRRAFSECSRMEAIELCDGLERIEAGAFDCCRSLKSVKTPSTVKVISRGAFEGCTGLVRAELCEGLVSIGEKAFYRCLSMPNIKIPASVKEIGRQAFYACRQLLSVEYHQGRQHKHIHGDAFELCPSLRSIAVPKRAHITDPFYVGYHDILMLLGSQDEIKRALKTRFIQHPAHGVCYNQSYYSSEQVLVSLKERLTGKATGDNQDCFGMTALHILACSTTQHLELYKIIVAKQPESLVTEDNWGCLPMVYALWVNAPQEIVQFLVDSHLFEFPDFVLNWDKMIATLSRAGVALNVVTRLLQIQRIFFVEQSVHWKRAAQELTVHFLVTCNSHDGFSSLWRSLMEALETSQAHQELIRSLLDLEEQPFIPPQNESDMQRIFKECVKPWNELWISLPPNPGAAPQMFHFFVKCNIPQRLSAIGIRKWRDIVDMFISRYSGGYNNEKILSKVVAYENKFAQLKDIISLLELALWAWKVNGHHDATIEEDEWKRQCRMTCGANIIIPNMLPYLIG